jgi:membrane-anchored protein YejM (alkaline phosphatase superfamily)
MGIYISFAAHFPYFDYGEDYRIMENDGRLISRYYNNLNLLDQMLKRVYDNLQKQGLLERTIFVIVGDHGQAFGQHHPDNYMHYRYSYNENLETSAFIYQPTLFKPRAVEFSTSHVDILPTVLDAMKIQYDPVSFDGESLFQNKLKRKYIFFYGLEECIASLDTNLIKVQYSLKENRGWAFDLKTDPDEKNPLDASSYSSQLEDLHRFVGVHDSNLVTYNAQLGDDRKSAGTSAIKK